MKLVYFASLREQLGCDQEELELPTTVTTVAELMGWLSNTRGGAWAGALNDQRLLCAVNQEMCGLETGITDSDEVALFPPVTGG